MYVVIVFRVVGAQDLVSPNASGRVSGISGGAIAIAACVDMYIQFLVIKNLVHHDA